MSEIMYDDQVQQFFYETLLPLPCPATQPPGDSEAETWVTFNEASALLPTASNGATRIRHLVQLHAWTRSEDDAHRQVFFRALELLRDAGVRVFSWGGDQYEQDTRIHHIMCTCEWIQK